MAATGAARNMPRMPKNSAPHNSTMRMIAGCSFIRCPTNSGSSTLLSTRCRMQKKRSTDIPILRGDRHRQEGDGMAPITGPTIGTARVIPANTRAPVGKAPSRSTGPSYHDAGDQAEDELRHHVAHDARRLAQEERFAHLAVGDQKEQLASDCGYPGRSRRRAPGSGSAPRYALPSPFAQDPADQPRR